MNLLPSDTSGDSTDLVHVPQEISVDWGFSALEQILFQFQRDLLLACGIPEKYIILEGGRGGGKTERMRNAVFNRKSS